MGAVIGEWGNKSPKNPVYPHLFPRMFPRFGLQVNIGLCTPLQRKPLIYQ